LGACAGKDFEARRDTTIIMFLLDTGARRGELADLQLGDLDLNLDVAIGLGKGRRERVLPYGRKTVVALDRYLRVRARHKDAYLAWRARPADRLGRPAARAPPWRAGRPTWGCTPVSSVTPSPMPGSPRAVARPT
jgi:integrase